MNVPALPVDAGVGASPEADIMPESGSAPATVLRSEVVDWFAVNYKFRFADWLNPRQLSTMFSDGEGAIMYDCRGVKHDTDIGGWNRRWEVLQSYFPGYVDPVGLSEMPMVHHKEESNNALRLLTSVEHAETVKGLIGFKPCCLDEP